MCHFVKFVLISRDKLPLTLDFMVSMVFEKMPGMFIRKFVPFSAFWYIYSNITFDLGFHGQYGGWKNARHVYP